MKASSPVRESVRNALRRPMLIVLEIGWRWTLGIASFLLIWLVVHVCIGYVSADDREAFHSLNAESWTAATAHVVMQHGGQILALLILLIFGLGVLWTIFAGVGRALTLRKITGTPVRIANVAIAQGFRAAVTIVCVVLFFGLMFLAADLSATSYGAVRWGVYLPLVLLDVVVTALLWMTGNWVLWLASITAGVHARFFGPKPSIFSSARRLSRDSRHLDLEIAFGVPRSVLFLAICAVSIVLGVIVLRDGGVIWQTLLGLLTLAYLAAADVLQIARVMSILQLEQDAMVDTGLVSKNATF